MEEYDVEFNFDLIEDTIINVLDFYNVAKDEFIAGNETEKGLKAVAEKLSRLIDCCDSFIAIRLMFIENRLNDENITETNKERLQNEIKYMSAREGWHKKLKKSINEECEKLIAGDYSQSGETEM